MTDSGMDVLDGSTSRSMGGPAARANHAAVLAVAEAVRTALGPQGLDKMLLSEGEPPLITNDGAHILGTATIGHPIARLVVDAIHGLVDSRGDGTIRTALIAAGLSSAMLHQFHLGMPSARLQKAIALLKHDLHEMLVINSVSHGSGGRRAVLRTSVGSNHELLVTSGLDVDSILDTLSDSKDCVSNRRSWQIHPLSPLALLKPGLHCCTLLTKRPVVELDSYSGGAIAIIDGGIEQDESTLDATVTLESPEAARGLRDARLNRVRASLTRLIEMGVNYIFVRDAFESELSGELLRHGVVGVRRVERSQLEHLARITGATLCGSIDHCTPEHLGQVTKVLDFEDAGVHHFAVYGPERADQGTIIFHQRTAPCGAQIERIMNRLLALTEVLQLDDRVVCGAGGTEAWLAKMMRQSAISSNPETNIAAKCLAHALDEIPFALHHNSGGSTTAFEPTQSDPTLKADISEACESVVVLRSLFDTAIDIAVNISRIDDVIWSNRGAEVPEGVGPNSHVEET